MITQYSRVRFKDAEKDKQYGVLLVFEIKNNIAFVAKGDYDNLGEHKMNVDISELKLAE